MLLHAVSSCVFIFTAVQNYIVRIHQILIIHSVVAGHLGCFQCALSKKDILTIRVVRSPIDFFSFLRISIYVRQGGRTCCLKAGVGSCSGTRI